MTPMALFFSLSHLEPSLLSQSFTCAYHGIILITDGVILFGQV